MRDLRRLAVVFCLFLTLSAWAFPVRVASSPEDDLSLMLTAIQGAQKSLLMNIYELNSPQITDAILNRIQAGVQVQILQEGSPVGGIPAAALGLQGEIVTAMKQQRGKNFLHLMSSKAGPRRFHYDHAKYAVIDGQTLVIGSENLSTTGHPVPGTQGNRGWEVMIGNPALAQQFGQMFADDSNLSHGDLLDLTGGGNIASAMIGGTNNSMPHPQLGGNTFDVQQVVPFRSPDTSEAGLIKLIQSAHTSLDVEQMEFESLWSTGNSPIADAVIQAAKRGVHVRVLLNDENVFNHGSPKAKLKNVPTMNLFNQIGSQGAPIEAKIANIRAMGVTYIHNKGALVDGHLTLISSINWVENSILHNRETAVVVDSPEVAQHYQALFNSDWQKSGGAIRAATATDRRSMTSAPSQVARVPQVPCPPSLQTEILIGKLNLNQPGDEDYLFLSNATLQNTFTQSGISGDHSVCMMRSQNRQYLEIRSAQNGSLVVELEGYTPSSQVFSIRAEVQNVSDLNQPVEARVFGGEGTRGDILGYAKAQYIPQSARLSRH